MPFLQKGVVFMAIYAFADLRVNMAPLYSELGDRTAVFSEKNGAADIDLRLTPEEIIRWEQVVGLGLPLAEYQLSGAKFCREILAFNGFVLHAAAVLYKDGVYLFSAPSGIGKSTHAAIWEKALGARVINDDKPAIRCIDGDFYAYGTPWCGSGRKTLDMKGRVRALYFIRRAEENSVKRLSQDKSAYLLFESTMRPDTDKDMDALFSTLDAFLKSVPVYALDCNTEDEAAHTAFSAVEEGL